jgi:hypothetical protein
MSTHRVRRTVRHLRSPLPWRSTAYLASYLPIGVAFFGVTVVVLVTATALNVTWLSLPLMLGATEIVKGCARFERHRAKLLGAPITESYRPAHGGLISQVRIRLADPATRRDCGYLGLLFPPLLVLDLVALVIWLVCLAGVALPLWYWAIPNEWHGGPTEYGALIGYLPDGPHGHRGIGVWIGSLPAALGASAVFLMLAPAAGALVVAAARVHAWTARSLLGPAADPLAAARGVLDRHGPLTAT